MRRGDGVGGGGGGGGGRGGGGGGAGMLRSYYPPFQIQKRVQHYALHSLTPKPEEKEESGYTTLWGGGLGVRRGEGRKGREGGIYQMSWGIDPACGEICWLLCGKGRTFETRKAEELSPSESYTWRQNEL